VAASVVPPPPSLSSSSRILSLPHLSVAAWFAAQERGAEIPRFLIMRSFARLIYSFTRYPPLSFFFELDKNSACKQKLRLLERCDLPIALYTELHNST